MILRALCGLALLLVASAPLADELSWPPKLPDGKTVDSGTSPALLKPLVELKPGVTVAKTAPTVDFAYYPGQDYEGKPWSVWGDSLVADGIYYSSIGDHLSPDGNALVYTYDPEKKELKQIVSLKDVLQQPPGHYVPGKIHSRLDMGRDGCLYFSTHRGSTRIAFDAKANFKGDWILRHNVSTGKTDVVAHAPLPMQCMPTGLLDPDRLIFYAGTADGLNKEKPKFLAYDCQSGKVLYSDDYGPYRYIIFAQSTGKIYFHGQASSPNTSDGPGQLVRFDPEKPGTPTPIDARLGLRSATLETPDGYVYTVDQDNLWKFNTKTEKAEALGPSAVASMTYTTSIDADPTGRYLYYVPGAHGGSQRDGTPLVQYDTKTRTRKVICFLHPYLYDKYAYVALGTFGSAVSEEGDKVYITWNGNRGTPRDKLGGRVPFNTCAMTVVHIPESERQP